MAAGGGDGDGNSDGDDDSEGRGKLRQAAVAEGGGDGNGGRVWGVGRGGVYDLGIPGSASAAAGSRARREVGGGRRWGCSGSARMVAAGGRDASMQASVGAEEARPAVVQVDVAHGGMAGSMQADATRAAEGGRRGHGGRLLWYMEARPVTAHGDVAGSSEVGAAYGGANSVR